MFSLLNKKLWPKSVNLDGSVLQIRKSKIKDAPKLVEIEKSVYQGYAPWKENAFRYEIAHPDGGVYLTVLLDGKIVAFIGSNLLPRRDLHITNFAVHKDFQRKRIGTMLLEEQIEFAKTKRARKVSLEVRKSNIFAQKTYYRFGFDITGEKPGYYDGDHEDAIYMEKFLNDDSV